jgi:DNA-binding transcriptional LysR family regulator
VCPNCARFFPNNSDFSRLALRLYAHPRGKLRVLVSFSEGLQLLAPHLPEFRKKYPDITLNIQLAERTVDIVQEHFDSAIQPECFVYSKDVVVRHWKGKTIDHEWLF